MLIVALGSSAQGSPSRVAILAHIDRSSYFVARHVALEGPLNGISRDLHSAMEFDLVCVNGTLESGCVDLAGVCASQVVAILLKGELLLAGAARVVDGYG